MSMKENVFRGVWSVLLAVALTMLLSCNPPDDTRVVECPCGQQAEQATRAEQPTDYFLRTYQLPAGYGQKILPILQEVLRLQVAVGLISLAPNDRLVVVAPEGIHQGIAAFVSDIGQDDAPEPQHTISTNYWIVRGTPADDRTSYQLGELNSALDAIVQSQGNMSFDLLEHVTLLSQESYEASVEGRLVNVRQAAHTNDNGISLSLQLHLIDRPNSISTSIQLTPGKMIVLAQVGMWEQRPKRHEEGTQDNDPDQDSMLFFIIQSDVTN